MAMEGEEPEYESDPEDSLLPVMRRREASDDEEGEGSDRGEKPGRAPAVGSHENSDGEGGAPGYEDEGEEGEELEGEEVDEEYGSEEYDDLLDEEAEYADDVRGAEGRRAAHGDHRPGDGRAEDVAESEAAARLAAADGQLIDNQNGDYDGKDLVAEGEKKENEPFAVPKAGAFYMHDDRFREQGGGRQRNLPGRRKLWESKDDRAWVHDRFEEMNMQEAHNDEGRRYRGRYRGRGRPRGGAVRDYGRGRRPQVFNERFQDRNERPPYDNRNRDFNDKARAYRDGSRVYNRNQAYDDNNQTRAPKIVKGRGPRRYESLPKTSMETSPAHSKPSVEVRESNQKVAVEKKSLPTSEPLPEPAAPRKQAFASSLNIASPPFYPSGSANLDSSVAKINMQTGNVNRNVPGSMLTDNFAPSSSSLRGKAVANYVPQERPRAEDFLSQSVGKTSVSLHVQSSGPAPVTTAQSAQARVQGRGFPVSGQFVYHQDLSQGQFSKAPTQLQLPSMQQRPVQAPVQPVLQVQHPRGGTLASSVTSSQSTPASEMGETDSSTGSSKSKSIVAVAGRGKAINAQGGGRGPFLYAGAPVIGANNGIGLVTGENFPGTPALLPVMQFSGQNPGGVGVGMALPGYVAQAQSGFGNSEMTWLPVLASAPGALGASYGPYIALDGGLYAHPTGQISSSSSRDSGSNKAANISKPPPKSDVIHDELGQRQNKPRRYSEMNFGQ